MKLGERAQPHFCGLPAIATCGGYAFNIAFKTGGGKENPDKIGGLGRGRYLRRGVTEGRRFAGSRVVVFCGRPLREPPEGGTPSYADLRRLRCFFGTAAPIAEAMACETACNWSRSEAASS